VKLIINAGSVFKGGSEQVALSFISECRNFNEHEYHVVCAPNLAYQLEIKKFPVNFKFHQIRQRPASNIVNYIKTLIWFKNLERIVKPDCVISTGGHGHWRPKAPLVAGFNTAHYIYPDSPFFRGLSLRKKLYWKAMRTFHLKLYGRLDAVLVQTEDVKNRLQHLLSKNIPIYVISNTVSLHYLKRTSFPPKLPPRQSNEVRLLTLSAYYPHKNLEIINPVCRILQKRGYSNIKFIVTLPNERFANLYGKIPTGMIFNVGPVPVKECPALYEECDFMFLPTLLECFSASYAEAMIMRKPILTSDLTFARTVCCDAAVYFDPMDPENIADKIISLFQDQSLQDQLIRKGAKIISEIGSSYDRTNQFLKICEQVSQQKNANERISYKCPDC